MLIEIGCRMIQYNTDGLFLICKKNKKDEYDRVIKEFEAFSRLTMETEEFKAMYQYAINDYIAVHSAGKVKEKGMFITKVIPGKGLTPKIIPKAVQKQLIEGIPIEDTIKNCTDIRDFLMSEKTGKQWTVEYGNEKQQRTNRFYASTKGLYLYKWKDANSSDDEEENNKLTQKKLKFDFIEVENGITKQYQNMLKGSPVQLLNEFTNLENIEDYNINYRYYICEALKIIEELKPRQLTLF